MRAASAFWRYCEASARYIFGDALGNPLADELLIMLRRAGHDGMSGAEFHGLFEHQSKRIAAALTLLLKAGRARRRIRTGTGGRGAEIWVAV